MEPNDQQNGVIISLYAWIPLVIGVFGITGNVLTLIVVLSKKYKKTSFSVYLGALAIVDTLSLISLYCGILVLHIFTTDVKSVSALHAVCKSVFFCMMFFTGFSHWIITILTMERAICLYFYQQNLIPGPKTGFIVVGSIAAVFVAFYSHLLYGIAGSQDVKSSACGLTDEAYASFYSNYFILVDSVLYYFLPVTLIIICNIASLIKVYKTERAVRPLTDDPPPSLQPKRNTNYVLKITLLVSATFVITLSPITLYITLGPAVSFDNDHSVISFILFLLYMTNYALNFCLYAITGSAFRQKLKVIICSCTNR